MPSHIVFCRKDGEWKEKLQELLRSNQAVTLFSLGSVKYDVLGYLNAHPNIQILEMSSRRPKKAEKGLGLKVKVQPTNNTGSPQDEYGTTDSNDHRHRGQNGS